MHGTDMTGHFAGFNQVGSTLQADGEGMELRPPGICLVVCLDAFGGIFLGDGGAAYVDATPVRPTMTDFCAIRSALFLNSGV